VLVWQDKLNLIKQSALSLNCLRTDHLATKYPSKSRCRPCHSLHHTILHRTDPQEQPQMTLYTLHHDQEPTQVVSMLFRHSGRALISTARA